MRKLDQAGIIIEIPEPSKKNLILAGKTFVLTGELENLTRDEAKARIRELGEKCPVRFPQIRIMSWQAKNRDLNMRKRRS